VSFFYFLNPGEQHQAWYQQHEGEQSPVSSQTVSNSNSSQHAGYAACMAVHDGN
jgi:hypothetical protein